MEKPPPPPDGPPPPSIPPGAPLTFYLGTIGIVPQGSLMVEMLKELPPVAVQ